MHVSIGIVQTKTLATIVNHISKRSLQGIVLVYGEVHGIQRLVLDIKCQSSALASTRDHFVRKPLC